jgi:hypothetical protein
MSAFPGDIPVTNPVVLTVATPGALVFHTPPGVASVKLVVPFIHIVVVPPIGLTGGDPFTTCVSGAEVLFEKFPGSFEV